MQHDFIGHYGIKDSVLRTARVVFREDHCRARTGQSAPNFSVLRRFVVATCVRRAHPREVCAVTGFVATMTELVANPCLIGFPCLSRRHPYEFRVSDYPDDPAGMARSCCLSFARVHRCAPDADSADRSLQRQVALVGGGGPL